MGIKVLIVRRAARIPQDDADSGSSPGTASTLSVVIGAGRDVPHDHGIQAVLCVMTFWTFVREFSPF